MSYLLGIDIGTTSAKTVLINETGETVASEAPEYAFRTPKPAWAECDPEDWWQAVIQAVRAILGKVSAEEITGVGLTGQMHGLVLLGAAGEVLRPCIMWNDQRASSQCAGLTRRIGARRVIELTGNPVLSGFTAPKALWVRENEPEVYARAAKILLPKDYIRYRLTGEYFTEVSDASGMSLLDVAKRRWSEEMLAACEIPRDWLAEVTESPEVSAKISAEAAEKTGLRQGTPVAGGGGDQAAQAVGCGIVRPGAVSATLGTSGVVFACSDEYRADPEGRLHAFCHAVPGKWHLMGVMLSAAGSYQWFRNTICQEELAREKETGVNSYDILEKAVARVPAGSEGLLFLPYLSGERTPHPDPRARGIFFGLSLRHTKAHMARAVLEGVSYGMRDSLELIRELGIRPEQIVASGGGARSPLWRQMLADVFGAGITTVNAAEGAAYGAALLAGAGTGVFPSVETACERAVRCASETRPGTETAVYRDYYPRYRALYPALREEFAALARTAEKQGG